MASWISIPENCDFSLQNLPYGIFSTPDSEPRIGTAIGDYVLDLKTLAKDGVFSPIEFDSSTLEKDTLNAYAGLDKRVHREMRHFLQDLLSSNTQNGPALRDNQTRRQRVLIPLSAVKMHLPMVIGDYTDFFVGLHHAENCFNILGRGGSLPGSFFTLPTAYHGRASSVVITDTPIKRPRGQILSDGKAIESPCRKLDFEVEFAAFIGRGNEMGEEIPVERADDHIFGVVLMNDWSARDIQQYEATPLGPFNSKNFGTTVSPWIVTLEALEPFRTATQMTTEPLDYLAEDGKLSAYDIPVQVNLQVDDVEYPLLTPNTKHVYFSFAQMLAHHTRGGCPMRTGDLIATGTLSGPTQREVACLLEATYNGAEAIKTEAVDGKELARTFLEDGDTVVFHAKTGSQGGLDSVGFGRLAGKILPSR